MSIELGQHARRILNEQGEALSLEQRAYVESVALRGEADELRVKLNGSIEIKETDTLQVEWQKQAVKLAALFASELGLSPEQYITSLPKFEPQPEEFKGQFDIPVIVETRLPLTKMLELAGVKTYFDVKSIRDWEKKKPQIREPYVTWMQNGTKNLDISVKTVRSNLAEDERAATVYDGLALFIQNPDILKHHYIDLPGSSVGSVSAPYLLLWHDEPRLDCRLVDFASPLFGSASCGRISK